MKEFARIAPVIVAAAVAVVSCAKDDCSVSSTCAAPARGQDGGAEGGGTVTVDGTPEVPIRVSIEGAQPVELRQGESVDVTIVVERRSGFDGDVRITLNGLPPGITFAELDVPAGQESATITLDASDSVTQGLRTISVVGTDLEGNFSSVPVELGVLVRGSPGDGMRRLVRREL